jgi:hypothetical protein
MEIKTSCVSQLVFLCAQNSGHLLQDESCKGAVITMTYYAPIYFVKEH